MIGTLHMKTPASKHLSSFMLGAALFSLPAQAENTITFIGAVTGSTCMPHLSGSDSASGDILLPLAQARNLPEAGSTTGEQTFSLQMQECATSSERIAKAYFYSPSGHVKNGRLTKQAGDGEGWQYQILDSHGRQIDVGATPTFIPNANDPGVKLDAEGSGSLNYRVRYYRDDAPLKDGVIISKAVYVMYFQ